MSVSRIPSRIVVDSLMMKTIVDAMPGHFEPERGPIGVFLGAPVFVNDEIGEHRGVIVFADGSIEKFGNWPTHEKGNENDRTHE